MLIREGELIREGALIREEAPELVIEEDRNLGHLGCRFCLENPTTDS